eukprot:COSAG04_NODE_23787_length_332_cov_0.669528_1_plen_75_part_10
MPRRRSGEAEGEAASQPSRLRAAFDEFDGDSNGVLTKEEAAGLLRGLLSPQQLSQSELDGMFAAMDADASGSVCF